MDQNNNEWIYFQFLKELQLPVYIKINAESFEEDTMDFLLKQGFNKIDVKEGEEVARTINSIPNGKILTVIEASASVSRQIESAVSTDRYGDESITSKPGYKVYRYKSAGLMIYSYGASEWQLAVYPDFGHKGEEFSSTVIISRFLGWALAPCGVLGIWGTPVDEGLVVMKANKCNAESIFIDVFNKKIITRDGVKRLKGIFKILRLDSTLRNRNVTMRTEELISFLCHHTTFIDHNGPTIPVRQLVHTISKMSEGLVHPEESFRPRAEHAL